MIQKTKYKLYRLFKTPDNVKFSVQLRTTTLSLFTSNKEKVPVLSKSHVVYQYKCPGCAKTYIGKTDTTLFRRTKEHGWTQKDSAVFKHFAHCQAYHEIVDMFEIDGHVTDVREFQINMVRQNTEILHHCDNWSQLCFLESLTIKDSNPDLNAGMKATKEPQLY